LVPFVVQVRWRQLELLDVAECAVANPFIQVVLDLG